jgi:hypothetical protein
LYLCLLLPYSYFPLRLYVIVSSLSNWQLNIFSLFGYGTSVLIVQPLSLYIFYIYSFEFPGEHTHFLQNNVTYFLLFILSLLLVYCIYNRLRNSRRILNSGVMLMIVFILLHAVFWHYDCVLYFWVSLNVALLVLLLKCFVDYYL